MGADHAENSTVGCALKFRSGWYIICPGERRSGSANKERSADPKFRTQKGKPRSGTAEPSPLKLLPSPSPLLLPNRVIPEAWEAGVRRLSPDSPLPKSEFWQGLSKRAKHGFATAGVSFPLHPRAPPWVHPLPPSDWLAPLPLFSLVPCAVPSLSPACPLSVPPPGPHPPPICVL